MRRAAVCTAAGCPARSESESWLYETSTQITPIVCDAHITEERTLTTATQTWTERMAEAAGSTVQVVSGGTGAPLLILHEEMGHPGWMRYHEALAQSFEITIPSHPGFGDSPFIDWIMNMRDLAGWYLAALDDMGIEKTSLLGFSFGGWLAAEIATMEPDRFDKLVLVNPMGIKPPVGEIFDMFLVVAKEFITESFLDPASAAEFENVCPDEPTPEQAERWEVAREQACRLGWRPYMYYAALPHLLRRLKKLPTRIIWGRENPIVPLSAGQVYHESIPGSDFAIIDSCGHRPEIERPDEFVSLVRGFLANQANA